MSKRRLTNWLESYLEYVDNTEPSTLYKKWVGVSTIAACLQRRVWLQWEKRTYANLFVILVGPPGKGRKGTAMAPAKALLKKARITTAADCTTPQALIKALVNCVENISDPEQPGIVKQHSSLTVFSPELTVLLGYGEDQFMTFMLDWYDCADEWCYETKNMGNDYIVGLWINLLGATTPALLQKSLPSEAITGGFTSRTIFVYASDKEKIVPFPIITEHELKLFEDLVHDMDMMKQLKGRYVPSKEWLGMYLDWYPSSTDLPCGNHPVLSSYAERRQTHLMKLCMIMSAARGDSMEMNGEDFKRAQGLLEETEGHMHNVFAGIGRMPGVDVFNDVMMYIANKGKVTGPVLRRRFAQDADSYRMGQILESLEKMRMITTITEADGVYIKWIGRDIRKGGLTDEP